ncbi:MAG: amino acid adenylation domain-containing protein, partial [Gordonia sp. (in: high G+C Gram-positive bacteria)]
MSHVIGSAQQHGLPVVSVDASGAVDLAAPPVTDAERTGPLRLENPMYTLFTSGSTGRPKGVTTQHRGINNRLWWGVGAMPIDETDRVVLKSPYTFDVSIAELFAPLMVGARIVILAPDVHLDPLALADEFARAGVTTTHFVPSMMSVFLDICGQERVAALTSLRIISTTGEALPPAMAATVRRWLPETMLVNLYGPTEASIEISGQHVEHVSPDDPSVPIGSVVSNGAVAVLDRRLRRVPVGTAGELYIGGVQVGRGYAGRADLTADRYVADPFGEPGARMYRTGDLVRWNARGELEYLGRTDFQVKLRGQRVELGEIETVISSVPGVVHTAATVLPSATGDQLVAWVSPASAIDMAEMEARLAEALPVYMRPTAWVVMDEMPLNPSGKVNRGVLPAPEFEAAEYVAPEGEREELVAGVFADVLGADQVSVTGSFFDLGGNSLSATRVAARVGQVLGVSVSVRDVFDAPSIRELAAVAATKGSALAPIAAVVPRPERIPLSFAQQRMWYVNQIDPSSAAYNQPVVLRLTGDLDLDALHAAVVDVVTRHEVLRTTFPETDGAPHQKIGRASTIGAKLDWDVVDDLDELREAVGTGFDVTKHWPIRARVWADPANADAAPADREFVVAVVVHHIAIDGESSTPLVTDLVTAYSARAADTEPVFTPLAVQFADFALWQHEVLGSVEDPSSIVGRQLGYWREALAGLPELVELPADRPRPAVASQRGAALAFEIPEAVGNRITEYATAAGVTPFMVVHAALAAFVARLTGVDDIAVGSPIAGRGEPVLDPLIGMFVNTLVLRTEVDPAASFDDLVQRARRTDLDAFANADVPFETIVADSDALRSQAFSPFTQVWMTLDQSVLPELAGSRLAEGEVAGLRVQPVAAPEIPAKVDLLVSIGRADEGPWHSAMVYAVDLFDESTVAVFAAQFVAVLQAATADPLTAVGDLSFGDRTLGDRVRTAPTGARTADVRREAKIVVESDAVVSGGPGSEPRSIAEMFAEAVTKWGPRQAVVGPDGTAYTYAQLDAAANRLARLLITRGIGPESIVAVSMGRSVHLLTAMIAISKTGAAYAPVDPSFPDDRRRAMLTLADVPLCVTDSATPAVADTGSEWLVIDSEAVRAELAGCSDAPVADTELLAPVRPDNVAYVIFTSGSTGRPKGIAVTNWHLHSHARDVLNQTSTDEYTRMLGFGSISFDITFYETLPTLMAGGTLIYRPDDVVGGKELEEYILRNAISHLVVTPTVLASIDPAAVPTVRQVVTGGEALPQPLKDQWAAMRRVQNFYGPSETTITVTGTPPLPVGEPVTLGEPQAGVGVLILDHRLRPVPAGGIGELYVTGGALARGYLERADLTATAFVANPYGLPGERMYRTGDIVRWRVGSDGGRGLEYSGRADDQVKLRGLRIELGEIEATLGEDPAVHSAVVVGIGGSVATALAAYLVAEPGAEIDVARVKELAGARLPSYMVPASIMVLDELPLTPIGKLDKDALPEPVIEVGEYVAPDGPAEEAAARIFADLLGLDQVSVTDSYFDLGGNSLSATRAAARVGEALGVDVSLRDMFEAPTVRDLVAAVAGRDGGLPPIVAADPRPARIPLSFAQQRMWVLNQLDPTSDAYNIPTVLKLTGDVDEAALRSAMVDVVRRHEVLRTLFPETADGPVQQIAPADDVDATLDWQVVDTLGELETAVRSGFDLTTEQPIRVRLWEAEPDSAGSRTVVFAVVMHHIAADGESTGPLLNDVLTAYSARSAGRAPEFAPMPVQFADFALWQHEALGSPDDAESVVGKQLAYWTRQLDGLPDVLELPADRPRPQVASPRGGAVTFQIPEQTAAAVVDTAAEYDMTPFMVVDAALSVLLAQLSATDDIAIATPVAGRGQSALDPVVGMFVNSLVLRSRVTPSMPFGDLLEQVRTVALDAYSHADIPFETLVDALDPVRSQAFEPLAQVMLSFNPSASLDGVDVEVAGLSITAVGSGEIAAQRDLTLVITQADGDWSGALTYAADLFDESTAQAMTDLFVSVLGQLTADTAMAVGDAALLGAQQRREIMASSTGAEAAVPATTVPAEVAAQVARTPDAEAIAFEGRSVSYAEFGARVNVLARELIAAGVGPDEAVAVVIDRSVEMAVAIHAVVAAGGQYVPIDSAAPADRVEYMVDTAGVGLVLVAGAAPDAVAALGSSVRILAVDCSAEAELSAQPITDAERRSPLHPDHALYTLFTSGSTGRPKGVTVSHRAVLNRLHWGLDVFSWTLGDRVIQKTPYTFDVSVPELFGPLLSGASMVVARPGGHADPDYLIGLLEDSAATSVHFVPSMMSVFLDVVDPDRVRGLTVLKWLFASGEALPPAVVAKAHALLPHVGIHNLFGPTEAAVEVTWADVSDAPDVVSIGEPVWNTQALVLDARLQPVPVGVPGELYLGGVQLARGYAAQGDLTADRFVADPLGAPGARMYRTGDLVRWNRSGQIEYLGRTDFQVKLRGQRIELGEIESVLAGAPGVVKAAVTVASAPAGGEHLVAYVCPATVDVDAIRTVAEAELPAYMVPSVWTVLDDLALNSAGKIDRRALPEPDFGSLQSEYVAPIGALEEQLAATMAAVLGLERLSATESFFALGGDSIMSIQLASAMRAVGQDLTPRQIFEHKTV